LCLTGGAMAAIWEMSRYFYSPANRVVGQNQIPEPCPPLTEIRKSNPEFCAQTVDIVDLVDEVNKKTYLSGEFHFAHKVHDVQKLERRTRS